MNEVKRPWERLLDLLETRNPDLVRAYLNSLKSEEIVRSISHMDLHEQRLLLTLLSPEDAADIIEDIPEAQAASIIETMKVKEAAAILNEMESDDQADLLSGLRPENAEAIIKRMKPEEAADVKNLIQYKPETAGGLMITEFLTYHENEFVGEVVNDLRENVEKYKKYNVQYLYVTADEGFVGVLQMKDLLMSKINTRLSEIVIRDTFTVQDSTTLDGLISFFDKYDFYGVPVLNDKHQLVGVVLRKHILEAKNERASIDLLSTQGIVGGEELRTMPLLIRSKRRLSWLSINILLNIMAASVIAFYQETLSAVIALAVFLPIISDMSGCSGNQAVAVSMRELSLGVVKPYEAMRVWLQEISVGLLNGLALGILIGLAAYLWKENIYLGLVVGGALSINTVLAVSLGGTLPLIIKKFGFDPALASGPVLTTITDMAGFFMTLSLASLMLAKL
ncbi:MAG: magnesium transporter [Cyclobacteriaceae bacterium]|nr:magnesium transporter [Cyclobacteriaceae bacterium]